MTLPQPEEIEVSVFGPGFGEAILIHLGGGRWLAVDSCTDKSKGKSAPLAYLEEIGVDPATQVVAIIATHWHGDHISGLYELIAASSSAPVYFSDALTDREFTAYISAFECESASELSGGASEFYRILNYIVDNGRKWYSASYDRRILNFSAEQMPYNQPCEVWTLSPSNLQYHDFLQSIVNVRILEKKTKFRANADNPNHLAIACQICAGDINILLGADLEEANHPDKGWQAVVSSQARPQKRSVFFKIPHHGSENAHYDPVWAQMLHENPIAVVTPYTRMSEPLPRAADIARIKSKTNLGYGTQRTASSSFKSVDKSIDRTISEMGATVKSIKPSPGRTTIRWMPGNEPSVSVHNGAYKL